MYAYTKHLCANNTHTTYPIGFPFLSIDHLIVTIDGVAQSLGRDYKLSPSKTEIIFNVTPRVNAEIEIRRDTSIKQRLTEYLPHVPIQQKDLELDSTQAHSLAQENRDHTKLTEHKLTEYINEENKQQTTALQQYTDTQNQETLKYIDKENQEQTTALQQYTDTKHQESKQYTNTKNQELIEDTNISIYQSFENRNFTETFRNQAENYRNETVIASEKIKNIAEGNYYFFGFTVSEDGSLLLDHGHITANVDEYDTWTFLPSLVNIVISDDQLSLIY